MTWDLLKNDSHKMICGQDKALVTRLNRIKDVINHHMSGYLHGTCSFFFSVNSSLKLYSKSTQVNFL